MVLRSLEQDNAKLDTRDRVTIDSIRHHTKRHFPVQNVARATYRRILERRAQENGVDFVKGVVTAITPATGHWGQELLARPGITPMDVIMGDAWRLENDGGAEVTHRVGRHVDRGYAATWA
jgi:hypothetical protein